MDSKLSHELHEKRLISDASFSKLIAAENTSVISVHWELRTLLYLGILLLSGGLGILIYQHIDSIGHGIIVGLIAAVSFGCFYYCIRHKTPYRHSYAASPGSFFDYILLLGCLTFVTLIGYLQFQYTLFGSAYGLAAFIPMLVLFAVAYYFDHLGVLAMAITALAGWAGLAVTPASVLRDNDFDSERIIFTMLSVGIALLAAGHFSVKQQIKAHFENTYFNFGTHLIFLSVLAAEIHFDGYFLLIFLLLAVICFLFYRKAIRTRSFYYILVFTVYGYIGASYAVIYTLFNYALDEGAITLACLWFIASASTVVYFLITTHKKLSRS